MDEWTKWTIAKWITGQNKLTYWTLSNSIIIKKFKWFLFACDM